MVYLKAKRKHKGVLPDFKSVPPPYDLPFKALCKLAFVSLEEGKVVLTKNEVDKLAESSQFSTENLRGLDLLKTVKFCSIKKHVHDISMILI